MYCFLTAEKQACTQYYEDEGCYLKGCCRCHKAVYELYTETDSVGTAHMVTGDVCTVFFAEAFGHSVKRTWEYGAEADTDE